MLALTVVVSRRGYAMGGFEIRRMVALLSVVSHRADICAFLRILPARVRVGGRAAVLLRFVEIR